MLVNLTCGCKYITCLYILICYIIWFDPFCMKWKLIMYSWNIIFFLLCLQGLPSVLLKILGKAFVEWLCLHLARNVALPTVHGATLGKEYVALQTAMLRSTRQRPVPRSYAGTVCQRCALGKAFAKCYTAFVKCFGHLGHPDFM